MGRRHFNLGAMGMLLGLLLSPAAWAQQADGASPAEPWQVVISSQIEAFRMRDAPGAFQYAAAGFHTMFPTPEAFFMTIIAAGYAPIMDSRSHSFGEFRKTPDDAVVQEVNFVGTDQSLYQAHYQLTEEEAGWRVQGVQLLKQPGMGV